LMNMHIKSKLIYLATALGFISSLFL